MSPLTTAVATSLKSRPVTPASCLGVQVEVVKKATREPRRSVIDEGSEGTESINNESGEVEN